MSIIFFQLVCNGNLLNIQIHHEFGVRAFIEENIVFQFFMWEWLTTIQQTYKILLKQTSNTT